MISQLTSLHFAPTKLASENLIKNGIKEDIFVSGNTVVDSLNLVSEKKENFKLEGIDIFSEKYILITVHRRENWGEPLKNISKAILNVVDKDDGIKVILPMHKNPLVRNITGSDNLFSKLRERNPEVSNKRGTRTLFNMLGTFGTERNEKIIRKNLQLLRNTLVETFEIAKLLRMNAAGDAGGSSGGKNYSGALLVGLSLIHI